MGAAAHAKVQGDRDAEARVSASGEHPDHYRLLLATRAGRLGIWDYDIEAQVMTCDAQWLEIMGLPRGQTTRSMSEFRAIVHPDDVERATEVPRTASDLLAAAEDYSIEFRVIRPDGEVRWVRSMASIVERQGQPKRAVGFVSDITEARRAEERLERLNARLETQNEELARQAMVDPLTGIANRRRFDQELERACARAGRSGGALSLAMIDVDYFKAYNDHFGHATGDEALRLVAGAIAAACGRPFDLAARYGGEEFAMILPGTADPAVVLGRVAAGIAALQLPHPASPVEPYLTVSCGCVRVPDGVTADAATLVVRSDKALYRAKQDGRNRTVAAGYEA